MIFEGWVHSDDDLEARIIGNDTFILCSWHNLNTVTINMLYVKQSVFFGEEMKRVRSINGTDGFEAFVGNED